MRDNLFGFLVLAAGIAVIVAIESMPQAETQPTAEAKPEVETALIATDHAIACPDLAVIRQFDRLALANDVSGMNALANARECTVLVRGERVAISKRIGGYRFVRIPFKWGGYWISSSYLETEARP